MKNKILYLLFILSITSTGAGMISGCGSHSNVIDSVNLNNQGGTPAATTPASSSTSGGNGGSGGSGGGNLLAPIYFDASLTGPGTPPNGLHNSPTYVTTTPIITDTLFRVRVEALSNVELYIPDPFHTGMPNNFSYNLSCAQYTVVVRGHSLTTSVLKPSSGAPYGSYLCPNAPAAQTLDFSADVAGGAGQSGVLVTVRAAKNDWFCLNYGGPYCPVADAYWNHQVHARICVQSDGHSDCQ